MTYLQTTNDFLDEHIRQLDRSFAEVNLDDHSSTEFQICYRVISEIAKRLGPDRFDNVLRLIEDNENNVI